MAFFGIQKDTIVTVLSLIQEKKIPALNLYRRHNVVHLSVCYFQVASLLPLMLKRTSDLTHEMYHGAEPTHFVNSHACLCLQNVTCLHHVRNAFSTI